MPTPRLSLAKLSVSFEASPTKETNLTSGQFLAMRWKLCLKSPQGSISTSSG